MRGRGRGRGAVPRGKLLIYDYMSEGLVCCAPGAVYTLLPAHPLGRAERAGAIIERKLTRPRPSGQMDLKGLKTSGARLAASYTGVKLPRLSKPFAAIEHVAWSKLVGSHTLHLIGEQA